MSVTVSFKVKKEIKEKMDKYKDRINWSEELRKFVENKIKELEREEAAQKIMEKLSKAPWSFPEGTAERIIRESRDASS